MGETVVTNKPKPKPIKSAKKLAGSKKLEKNEELHVTMLKRVPGG